MDSSNYSADQWADQQHAEAVRSLKKASYYVLVTVDQKDNIKIQDGSPGDVSFHDRYCALSMLKSFAGYHRKVVESEFENDEPAGAA